MPTLRVMPKIVTLTAAAARRIRSLMDANPKALGLRVGIKKGGCAGMEYTMAMVEEKSPHDEVIEQDGAILLIEPTAIMYLLGTEMDFQTDKLSSQFVFNNPNQRGACGCGESVNLVPAAEKAPHAD
ncbi:Fe-S cluster assembly scaffold SufA [Hyphomicrobium sulfonivorans]|uniref:Iron binding protein SufA for iron-sulfur cluster assembly n=1 Tax=Hyphomicrobium sulfonivorans TaxID=121290 RepID=A0A109BKT7_HYPSL|nr:Fe-S cluster assembly scaffold SufA [Hyphomicrobium sulfonivorans]KWT70501.1 Iron binding protein SufA for iron-sulfur cluster assembly [Hyphomicrobium sulfonivorans]MBI1650027.1 Fe-S cluster assembly scaffold SufA [Hyphomicrobium sulfonivorans]NSL72946.1 Fe-S cluster assembly scaffold SufA [Hyphomicrobium sulfonivorans]